MADWTGVYKKNHNTYCARFKKRHQKTSACKSKHSAGIQAWMCRLAHKHIQLLEAPINPGTHTQIHTLARFLMPSQLPARLPSYYLSARSERKMQMFVSLKIESVTAKLRAICKNGGTNSLKCLHGRERRARARGLTDCSIRKPITAGWTNLPWCFNKSPAFLTLRTISLLPPDFVAGFCGAAVPLSLTVLQSCLAIGDMQAETHITTERAIKLSHL